MTDLDKAKEIRWKQRFVNLQKVYKNLEDALEIEILDNITRAGLIQYFEFTIELIWKTYKNYLENAGYKNNRASFTKAYR